MKAEESNPQCPPHTHNAKSSRLGFAPCLFLSVSYAIAAPPSQLKASSDIQTKAVFICSDNQNPFCAWIKIWQQMLRHQCAGSRLRPAGPLAL